MNYTSIQKDFSHSLAVGPAFGGIRNDVKKSRHPGKCEAFIQTFVIPAKAGIQ